MLLQALALFSYSFDGIYLTPLLPMTTLTMCFSSFFAHYTCIACITLDSVLKINKKNYPQVYLEECKYKVKKIRTPRFINIELESDSEPDVETDLDSNTITEN